MSTAHRIGGEIDRMSTEPRTPHTKFAHIAATPGIVGGEPRISGTRIRVRDVVAVRDLQAATPEEIATIYYPHLSLAQVYAALAYYEDHRQEIDSLKEEEATFIADMRRSKPPYLDVGEGE